MVLYGYGGFKDSLNINKALIAPFAITAAFALLRNNGLPSYFFLNIIIVLTVIPSLVIFSGSNLPFLFIAVTLTAFVLIVLLSQYTNIPRIRMKHININTLLLCIAILCLLLIASMFAFGGAKYINFNLLNVYQFREDATENLPGVYGYFVQSFSKVIVPMGIVLSLIYRKWMLLCVFIFSAVMLFALSSHKTPLFIPIVVIFVYWFSRYKNGVTLALFAFIILVIIGGLDFYLQQSGMGGFAGLFGSLFVRRSIIAPSYLNWGYYDFFSNNPYSYWAGSKLSLGLVDKAYDISLAHVIGEEYFGKEGLSANTGWIGSGMGQAGHFGIVFYSILIGLIISFLDSYSKKLGYSFVLSFFIIAVMTMTSSADLITMLLTHGLLISLFILIFLPRFANAKP